MVAKGREVHLLTDGVHHGLILGGIRVRVAVKILRGACPLQLLDDPPGDKVVKGGRPGEVQVLAPEHGRRAGGPGMDLPGAVLVEEVRGLPQLGASDNGVVDKQQAAPLYQLMDGDELHMRDKVPLALEGGHKGPGPGGGILYKGPGEGYARGVGVAHGVGGAGVGHAGHVVWPCPGETVPLCQKGAAVVAHLLHVDSLVRGGGVAVIYPEEGAYLHITTGSREGLHSLGRDGGYLAGTQLPLAGIAQVEIGKALEGDAAGLRLFTDCHRGPAKPVPGGQYAPGGQKQQAHGAVDGLLGIAYAFEEVLLLVYEGGHQLRLVDIAAAHFHKMGVAPGKYPIHQLPGIVYFAHGDDGIGAVMGAHD